MGKSMTFTLPLSFFHFVVRVCVYTYTCVHRHGHSLLCVWCVIMGIHMLWCIPSGVGSLLPPFHRHWALNSCLQTCRARAFTCWAFLLVFYFYAFRISFIKMNIEAPGQGVHVTPRYHKRGQEAVSQLFKWIPVPHSQWPLLLPRVQNTRAIDYTFLQCQGRGSSTFHSLQPNLTILLPPHFFSVLGSTTPDFSKVPQLLLLLHGPGPLFLLFSLQEHSPAIPCSINSLCFLCVSAPLSNLIVFAEGGPVMATS